MSIFLLIYDRRTRRTKVREYAEADRSQASADRVDAELANLRRHSDQEIVVLEADSLAALQQTHAAYFEDVSSLTQRAGQIFMGPV
jgi:hypothetical protein